MNKLVRDRIVELLEGDGVLVTHRVISDDAEFEQALNRKLDEEHEEYRRDRNMEELCDMAEVIYELVELKGGWPEFTRTITAKREKKGAFKKRIFVDEVEYPE